MQYHYILIAAIVIIVIAVVLVYLVGGFKQSKQDTASNPTTSKQIPSPWLWLLRDKTPAEDVVFNDGSIQATFSDGNVNLVYTDGKIVSGTTENGATMSATELARYSLVGAGKSPDSQCQTYTFAAPGPEQLPTVRDSILATCGSGGPCVKEDSPEQCNDIDQFRAIPAKRRCVGQTGFAGPVDTSQQCLTAKGEWVPSGTLETLYVPCDSVSTVSSLFCDGDLNILYMGFRGGSPDAVYWTLDSTADPIVQLLATIDLTVATDGFAQQLFRVTPYQFSNSGFVYSRQGQFLKIYDRRTQGFIAPTLGLTGTRPDITKPVAGAPLKTYKREGGQLWINLPPLANPAIFTYLYGSGPVPNSFFQDYLDAQVTNLTNSQPYMFYDRELVIITGMDVAGILNFGGTLREYLTAITSEQPPSDLPTATVPDLLAKFIDYQDTLHDYIIANIIPPGNMNPAFPPRMVTDAWEALKLQIGSFIPVSRTILGGLLYVPDPSKIPSTPTELWAWVMSQNPKPLQVVRNGIQATVQPFVPIDAIGQAFNASLQINVWSQISPVVLSLP